MSKKVTDEVRDLVRHGGADVVISAKRHLSERDIHQLEYEVALEEKTRFLSKELRYFRTAMLNSLKTTTYLFITSIIIGFILSTTNFAERLIGFLKDHPFFFCSTISFLFLSSVFFNLIHHFLVKNQYTNHELAYERKLFNIELREKELKLLEEKIMEIFKVSEEPIISSNDILSILNKQNLGIEITPVRLGFTLKELRIPKKRSNEGYLYALQRISAEKST